MNEWVSLWGSIGACHTERKIWEIRENNDNNNDKSEASLIVRTATETRIKTFAY